MQVKNFFGRFQFCTSSDTFGGEVWQKMLRVPEHSMIRRRGNVRQTGFRLLVHLCSEFPLQSDRDDT